MLFWWSWTGLNRRPPACKAGALPAELQPHLLVFFSPCGGALWFRLGHVRLCTFPASKPCASCRVRKNPARMSGARNTSDKVVGLERLELSTSRLSGVRSNHLSYRPLLGLVRFRLCCLRRRLGHVYFDTLPSSATQTPCRKQTIPAQPSAISPHERLYRPCKT